MERNIGHLVYYSYISRMITTLLVISVLFNVILIVNMINGKEKIVYTHEPIEWSSKGKTEAEITEYKNQLVDKCIEMKIPVGTPCTFVTNVTKVVKVIKKKPIKVTPNKPKRKVKKRKPILAQMSKKEQLTMELRTLRSIKKPTVKQKESIGILQAVIPNM